MSYYLHLSTVAIVGFSHSRRVFLACAVHWQQTDLFDRHPGHKTVDFNEGLKKQRHKLIPFYRRSIET